MEETDIVLETQNVGKRTHRPPPPTPEGMPQKG